MVKQPKERNCRLVSNKFTNMTPPNWNDFSTFTFITLLITHLKALITKNPNTDRGKNPIKIIKLL